MIREWMLDDGNVKRYDTVTLTVQIVDRDGVNIDAVRPATEDDTQQYLLLFPEASVEKNQQIFSTQALIKGYLNNFDTIDLLTESLENLNILFKSGNDIVKVYSGMSYEDLETSNMIVSLYACLNSINAEILDRVNKRLDNVTSLLLGFHSRIDALELSI